MPLTSTADLSKSAIHIQEATTLGTRTPAVAANALTGATGRLASGTFSATIPTAAANVTTVVSVTIAGVQLGDVVIVSGPTVALAHQTAPRAQVTAANTIELSASADGTGFTGAAKTYNYVILRQS